MYDDTHRFSYLINSIFIGEGITHVNWRQIEDLLVNLPSDEKNPVEYERKIQLFSEINQFFISCCLQKESKSFIFQMAKKTVKTPYQHWKFDGEEWPLLQEIVNTLFTMGTSSTALERNFYTMRFIHTKLRDIISTASMEKLV